MKEPGLLSLDPTFCISVRAREHLETLPWWVRSEEAPTSSVHLGVSSEREVAQENRSLGDYNFNTFE